MHSVTLTIKTFERPRHLSRLIKSIRLYYPALPVIVADDSNEPSKQHNTGIKTIRLPYDTGLSEGRNRLVQAVKTDYMVLLDDDYIFTPATDLDRLLMLLEANRDIDILGGKVLEHPNGEFVFHGLLEKVDGRYKLQRRRYREQRNDIKIVDIIPNFFMARTAKLKTVKWNPELKLSEHMDFFIRAKQSLTVGICEDVSIQHDRGKPTDTYKRARSRSTQFQRIFERAYGYQPKATQNRSRSYRPIIHRTRR